VKKYEKYNEFRKSLHKTENFALHQSQVYVNYCVKFSKKTPLQTRQNSQESSGEVLVNTDRLMSSLESRLSGLIRSEIGSLKNQISRVDQTDTRLENVVNSLKSDVAGLKSALEAIRGNLNITTNK
jgi:peptidoglycan hydrolase CwlO-like protein